MASSETGTSHKKFIGGTYYDLYKDATFLQNPEDIEMILTQGYELRQELKTVELGKHIHLRNLYLSPGMPLLVKNTLGDLVPVENFEFTFNRLTGLTAAYVFENRHRFQTIKASEAEILGLEWDNKDESACRIYLSAVSGAEHFPEFSFYPLICALRKFQLEKITLKPVTKIANVKNHDGDTMATCLYKNLFLAQALWMRLGGTKQELDSMLSKCNIKKR